MSASSAGSVLLVVHALPPEEATGTPLAAHGYAAALSAAGWSVTVLATGADAPGWDMLRMSQREGERFFRVRARADTGAGTTWLEAAASPAAPTPSPWGGRSERDAAGGVRKLLGRVRPQLVHVVDNVHLPLSIPEVARDAGIPAVRTVSCAEDLCALIAPVSPYAGPSGFCQAPLTIDRCARCLSETSDAAVVRFWRTGDRQVDDRRRAEARHLLAAKRARAVHQLHTVYDRILFASERFRAYFEQTLPLDPWRTRVVPMGVDLPPARYGARAGGAPARYGSTAGARAPLTFLLAATGHPAKGIDAVVDAFSHTELAGRDDWRLLLAGGGDRSLGARLRGDPRVRDHGPYAPEEMPALLGEAHVGLSASYFETFHRVTREYLAGGLPVLGSTAFGITDVVVHGVNGWLFDHGDEGSLRRALVRLLDDRALVGRLRAAAAATSIRSVAEEVDDLQAIYREVLDRPRGIGAAGGGSPRGGGDAGGVVGGGPGRDCR